MDPIERRLRQLEQQKAREEDAQRRRNSGFSPWVRPAPAESSVRAQRLLRKCNTERGTRSHKSDCAVYSLGAQHARNGPVALPSPQQAHCEMNRDTRTRLPLCVPSGTNRRRSNEYRVENPRFDTALGKAAA
jgi:hypothetical protein